MNGQSIQEIQKFLFGELRVLNDFKQETGSDIFASMYWNDCHSPIGMAHDNVASLLTNLQKADFSQGPNGFFRRERFHATIMNLTARLNGYFNLLDSYEIQLYRN